MAEPDTGLVIVNYNSGECLRRCIASVATTDIPLTIIVIDNNSRDDSVQGIEDGPLGIHTISLIENIRNRGFAAAVNQGVEKLDTAYLMLLNPDCVIFPHTVPKLRTTLKDNRDAAIVGALVFNEDGTEQRGCRRNEPSLRKSAVTALGLGRRYQGVDRTYQKLPRSVVSVDAVSGAAMMILKERFDEAGGMDEDYFLHCEDLDICRNVRDLGYDVLFDPGVSVFHRQGASGSISSLSVEWHKHKGMSLYHDKHKSRKQRVIDSLLTRSLIWSHYAVVAVAVRLKPFLQRVRSDSDAKAETGKSSLPDFSKKTILVTGAKSDVGDYLLKKLAGEGYQSIAITRTAQGQGRSSTNVRWLTLDYLRKVPQDDFGKPDAWINLAPIWTSRPLYKILGRFQIGKIIALSSTSVTIKSESTDESEQSTVDKLKSGERWLEKQNRTAGMDATVVRPTMIYGGPRNQNINFIENIIRYCRCFPIIDAGRGLRQPVHAEDIADACVKLLESSSGEYRVYNLAGGERLSYRDMVGRVFDKLGVKPRILKLPLPLVKKALAVIRLVPGFGFLTPQMADRMCQDLVFSSDQATSDFNYSPRQFEP